jgi:hypothetical protein
MPKPPRPFPTYHIKTLEDMTRIPKDRIDAFLQDLRTALLLAHSSNQMARSLVQSIDPEVLVVARLLTLDWIDDGAHHMTPTFDDQRMPTVPQDHVNACLEGMDAAAAYFATHPLPKD